MSRSTVSNQRVLAVHLPNGSSLLISKSLAPTNAVMTKLKWVLLVVGGIGVVIAAIAGGMVARTGLRPVGRLTEAAERVARTDDLRPIPVFGSDELARLTETFNTMLRALTESRERQARLVADAGHELRTPLTSLRTNVELLMASMEPGAPRLPEDEMAELRTDVIAQIEELSTLVGDLVDLTREDAGGVVHEAVDMSEVIDRSLERVRRRRNDIEFDVDVVGWQVFGDAAGLSRAVLNLLDNAAKWSPSGRPCRRAAAPARRRACRTGGLRPWTRNSAPGTGSGVRAVLPVDVRAGDAGVGPRPGDRQTGRGQARRHDPRRRHRPRRAAARDVVLRAAARPADQRHALRGFRPQRNHRQNPQNQRWREVFRTQTVTCAECYLSRFSVAQGKLVTTLFCTSRPGKERSDNMTDHPRYSSPQQPGQPGPNQHAAPGYPQAPQAGYQQPYDWRYATQQLPPQYRPPYDPYQAARQGNPPTMSPVPPRRRSRAGALTAGALAIAVVSAGIGGGVVLLAHPDHQRVTTINSAGPNGPANVPAANLPVGSVEQVAAKVVPSVVKLETEMGRQSEEGSGIILSSDGLILTNNHVVAAAAGKDPGNAPAAPPPPSRACPACRRPDPTDRPGGTRWPGCGRAGRRTADHHGHLRRRPHRDRSRWSAPIRPVTSPSCARRACRT